MPTSLKGLTLLLLPGLLLAGGVRGTLLAQDTATATSQGRQVVTGSHTVAQGEVVDDIVVVGGDLRVQGEVRGDAVVVGGNLILEATGAIQGDAVITGGRMINEGGRVSGEMRSVDGVGADISREVTRAVTGATAAAEAARGNGRAAREAARSTRRGPPARSWMDPIRRGFAGIISTLALGLVLGGIGASLVFYGRPYLEAVSDTARSSVIRAGLTGLAASFLVIPAFVVLIVALAVSIIGIPFLLIAVPLYPLALFSAAVFGMVAVAHAIGERTAEQSRDSFDLRYRNSYAYLFTGLGMLLMPLIAAHLIGMTGFLGFIGTLLKIATWMVIWTAATVGFGAVILSRAGTRRSFVTQSRHSDFEDEDLFGEGPLRSAGNA
jgi:hypothetical protein